MTLGAAEPSGAGDQSVGAGAQTIKELVASGCGPIPRRKATHRPAPARRRNWSGRSWPETQTRSRAHAVGRSQGVIAVQATVGNHTPISFGALAPAVPLIEAGRSSRAGDNRQGTLTPALPDVPTMAEAGFPEVEGSHLDRGRCARPHAEGDRRQAPPP